MIGQTGASATRCLGTGSGCAAQCFSCYCPLLPSSCTLCNWQMLAWEEEQPDQCLPACLPAALRPSPAGVAGACVLCFRPASVAPSAQRLHQICGAGHHPRAAQARAVQRSALPDAGATLPCLRPAQCCTATAAPHTSAVPAGAPAPPPPAAPKWLHCFGPLHAAAACSQGLWHVAKANEPEDDFYQHLVKLFGGRWLVRSNQQQNQVGGLQWLGAAQRGAIGWNCRAGRQLEAGMRGGGSPLHGEPGNGRRGCTSHCCCTSIVPAAAAAAAAGRARAPSAPPAPQ